MNGVAAVVQILHGERTVTELVPQQRISAGVAPLGTALPSIAVTSVSLTDMNLPSPGRQRFVRQRVQVTVMAASYVQQAVVQAAVRRALDSVLDPAIAGIDGVSVHSDGGGDDFMNDEASIFMGAHDYLVKYSEDR